MIFKKIELDLESKAVHSQSGRASSLTTMLPDTARLTQDPVQLMAYNRGYVYAANTKVAGAVGSLPFRMYAYVPDTGQKMITRHKVLEGKALDWPRSR